MIVKLARDSYYLDVAIVGGDIALYDHAVFGLWSKYQVGPMSGHCNSSN